VMKWIGSAIPVQNRWSPVFERYLQDLGGRCRRLAAILVRFFRLRQGMARSRPPAASARTSEEVTGKISKLVFDHFGDFDGFVLETNHGSIVF